MRLMFVSINIYIKFKSVKFHSYIKKFKLYFK